MAIQVYKRTSPGRRNSSVNMHVEVTKHTPEKSLLTPKPKKGGRNHHGKITAQHRGGGAKQRYRQIDFKRNMNDVPATVIGIEYDPNRSAHIALLEYEDKQRRYILAPMGLTDGEQLMSSHEAIEPKVGNCMPLACVPSGLNVHSIEMSPGRGGQLCRTAGSYARLTNKEAGWAMLVMPSGELRQVSLRCRATIGQVGNSDHALIRWGKAGRSRYKGRRPRVRGVAMNHNDHPHGGGEGRSKGGRTPVSATGVKSKGGRTRKRSLASDKRIIRRRRSKRYGQLTL